ncbi:hypothetical protein ASG75_00685 [Rhodanobacter sp. Soil772]|uniref:hypothetical protein n=1 Tax=Rhodanobacter sp. Soil772 TaxID=1736406 RepID=UPI0006F72907|nr:hypothetical protein [Rhodanobacter sp. Soil772]KRE86733.1 hypothetical protein ASG75_00685 [Rhodanobacter sp. Soil772]
MMELLKSPAGTPMTNESLTYALIEKKIDQYVKDVGDDKPGIVERLAFGTTMVSWMPLLLATQFAKSQVAVIVLAACTVLPLIALGVSMVCFVRREWRTFHRKHDKLSRELDRDYDQWRELVAAVRRFPRAELARRLRYLSTRKSSLVYRLGLVTGSVQRLGILPLLAILYVQFKDWRFGDWQAFGQVHMLGGLLLWALFLTYLLSWWAVGLGTRWDAYEALLIEATCDE